mmetsp:Transcript_24893/g.44339  ORF Transcript_24893/g.44339 Transcript_24893/m.44339 type:complete len:304 (+) Transcript_24893:231-1142(+)
METATHHPLPLPGCCGSVPPDGGRGARGDAAVVVAAGGEWALPCRPLWVLGVGDTAHDAHALAAARVRDAGAARPRHPLPLSTNLQRRNSRHRAGHRGRRRPRHGAGLRPHTRRHHRGRPRVSGWRRGDGGIPRRGRQAPRGAHASLRVRHARNRCGRGRVEFGINGDRVEPLGCRRRGRCVWLACLRLLVEGAVLGHGPRAVGPHRLQPPPHLAHTADHFPRPDHGARHRQLHRMGGRPLGSPRRRLTPRRRYAHGGSGHSHRQHPCQAACGGKGGRGIGGGHLATHEILLFRGSCVVSGAT